MSDRTCRSRRQRIANAPILGLTLGALVGIAGAAAAAPALPTGGQVAAGQASIAKSSASSLTIDQTSSRAIIDWSSFSISRGGTVRFDNGSGATLNRVTGPSLSSIDGLLSATGSVYLINPNGVIIGKSGVVDTGGTFVASTQDLTNASFMTGVTLTFSGKSAALVLNLGKVGSLGGDVVLIASKVENDGTITATQGDVALAAGYQVVMSDQTQNDGKFQVLVGGSGTAATNTGAIQAAEAELRANGGNVYALAGNTGGIVRATGVSTNDGKVLLIAENGALTANGTVAASGEVETSGETVNFDGLKVKAASWLVDPTNLIVDAAAATSIDNAFAYGTSVTLETTATGSSGPGVASTGAGNITIAAPIRWLTGATLTLEAYNSIHIDAAIAVDGPGHVVLNTNAGNAGGAGVYDFGLTAAGFLGSLSFTDTQGAGQSVTINGTPYTLIYSMTELAAINGVRGEFALANSLTAGTYLSAVVGSLDGVFTGLGHTISGLTIAGTTNDAGLFGTSEGEISDIGVVGGSVSGGYGVGDLVGEAGGLINDVYATGRVSAPGIDGAAGGLVGELGGSITDAFATGAVSAQGKYGIAGGLVGSEGNGGSITDAYATGAVSIGTGGDAAGGLVGYLLANVEGGRSPTHTPLERGRGDRAGSTPSAASWATSTTV